MNELIIWVLAAAAWAVTVRVLERLWDETTYRRNRRTEKT